MRQFGPLNHVYKCDLLRHRSLQGYELDSWDSGLHHRERPHGFRFWYDHVNLSWATAIQRAHLAKSGKVITFAPELQKVRALNLANSGRTEFECKNLAKMTNLHFLVLDGCNVVGDLGSISEELRWLRWRYMPLAFIPPTLNLSNLISLDFSESTMLARTWVESDPAFEACPNLLKLDLRRCTSITTLPDSIGRLSRLQLLNLHGCEKLQKLPSCVGRLTALQALYVWMCGRLEVLLESITALSGLRSLGLSGWSSISNLLTTFGPMTGLLDYLFMDLGTEERAVGLARLIASIPRSILVTDCSDEAISVLDGLGALCNLYQVDIFSSYRFPSMTKLPETIGVLTNLGFTRVIRV